MQQVDHCNKLTLNQLILIGLWIGIGALSRILPHPANMTAMTSVSLLAGVQFSRLQSLIMIVFSLLLSDLVLAYAYGYSILGSWSLFTYSGFLLIAFLSSFVKKINNLRLFGLLICSSLGFWLWTNFGTWLCSGLYSKNLTGLSACYIAALPFLRNQLIGDVAWMLVLFGIMKLVGFSTKLKYHQNIT